jgi:hypothetical protein
MNKKQQLITQFLKKNNSENTKSNEPIIKKNEISNHEIIDNYFTIDDKNTKQQNINEEECYTNRCIVCNIDMGFCNPRQYCGKTYCKN